MSFNEKLPTWEATGVEPPDTKKSSGWQAEDKPPAAWWNWLQNRTYKSIKELQTKSAEKDWVTEQINGVSIPDASLSVKGKTALSSLTNSIDETKAATPKAVKTVADSVAAHLADYTLQVPYAVATGTANTYAITLPIASLVTGMAVTVKLNVDSTGAATLNWSGKGAKGIKKANGTDATNLKANGVYTLRYDGTAFILQGEGGGGTVQADQVESGYTFTNDYGEQIGKLDKQAFIDALISRGISASINDAWSSLPDKIKQLFGVGSNIDVNRVIPPVILPTGGKSQTNPSFNSIYYYTTEGGYGDSLYRKYDLNGKYLGSFGLSGLNDSDYHWRGPVYPVPFTAGFYYITSNSYDGDIRYGYNSGPNNTMVYGSLMFAQSGEQNSAGGNFGILGVAQDGSLYCYGRDGMYKKKVGSTTLIWSTTRNNAGYRLFWPIENNLVVYINFSSSYINILNNSGILVSYMSMREDGASNSSTPQTSFYDYEANELYIVLGYNGDSLTARERNSIKKYKINTFNSSIALVATYDLSTFFSTSGKSASYFKFGATFENELIFTVGATAYSTPEAYSINKALTSFPVKHTYLTDNFDLIYRCVSTDMGRRYLIDQGILNKSLKYTII
ncbi:hypothetical protein J2Z69_003646 [Paenibacillus shirakamiensis]|uniref:Uncharacterized protein n=1 Tax=Paenibacillus shirakamiensis TaxID=1265935 RepID=A0ABS4JLG6_9BACL|nr:phage tail protein [Paenibacillus shirakamiensis]MBP2002560.1 hypothetical protein [Paenibacillus shirakamiensis]